MAQAGITDSHGRLGDVALPGAQELRGALQSDVAQIARNGEARIFRENAAQVERAASNLAPEFRKGWWVLEVGGEKFFDLIHALQSEAFVALAKHFGIRLGKRVRGDFENFCMKPEPDSRTGDWRLEHLLHRAAHTLMKRKFPGAACAGCTVEKVASGAIEGIFVPTYGCGEKLARHFHGEKTVALGGMPVGAQAIGRCGILGDRLRIHHRGLRAAFVDCAAACEVNADLEALWMEAFGPRQRLLTLEIVPFDTYTLLAEISEKWTPFTLNSGPNRRFSKSCFLWHGDR